MMLAGYPSLRSEGPPRLPTPPCSRPRPRYAHRTRPPQWHSGGHHGYVENTLERKNFQASAFRESLRNRSSILSPHEQLLSRIDRYQCDPAFRTEMRERYQRLMKRVDHPFDPELAPRRPISGRSTGMMSSNSATGLPKGESMLQKEEENKNTPKFLSAETQTGPDLGRVTIRRPSSAKLSRSVSAGALPRRPRSATPQSRHPDPRAPNATTTLRTWEQTMLN